MFKEDFCVVGNAPSELGKGSGGAIDACEQVFRFNNYRINGFEEDYGTKTTHWVTTYARDITPRPANNIVCPLPLNIDKHRKRYNFTHPDYLKDNFDNTNFIPVEIFEELKSIIPNPSTGIALLYWIRTELGHLDPDRVYGFSFFDKSQAHHYFDKNKACNHNGDIEKQLFHEMIK